MVYQLLCLLTLGLIFPSLVSADVLDTADYPKLIPLNGKLYFTATDSEHGKELWQYNPETQIASLIEDGIAGEESSEPDNLVAFDNKLYFSRYNENDSLNLWSLNPDTGLLLWLNNDIPNKKSYTFELADQHITASLKLDELKRSVIYQNKLYFEAIYDDTFMGPWGLQSERIKTLYEITPTSTTQLPINDDPYSTYDYPGSFIHQGRIYSFDGYTEGMGGSYAYACINYRDIYMLNRGKWSCLSEFKGWYNGYFPSYKKSGDLLYTIIRPRDEDDSFDDININFMKVFDLELGTSEDITVPDSFSSRYPGHPERLHSVDVYLALDTPDALYISVFTSDEEDGHIFERGIIHYKKELYKLDKHTNEIAWVANFPSFDSNNIQPHGANLYQFYPAISELHTTLFNNTIYFSHYEPTQGIELYKLNNTNQQIELAADILTGSDSSQPENFTLFNNKLFFTVNTNETETSLAYYDDGTNTVTVIDQVNIAPSISLTDELQQVDERTQVQIPITISDEDGDELDISWQQTAGEPEIQLTIGDEYISFDAPDVSENTTISFIVNADDGEVTKAKTLTVEIIDINHAPTIALTNSLSDNNDNLEINEGDSITITAETRDLDGDDVTITWAQTAGTNNQDLTNVSDNFVFTTPQVSSDEDYSFEVTVTDGELTTTQSITIKVVHVNQAPTIVLTNNLSDNNENLAINEGDSITITAETSDPDSDDVTISWAQIAGTVNQDLTDVTNSFVFNAPQVSGDEDYNFEVSVTDGELTTTQNITIKVLNVPSAPIQDTDSDNKSGGAAYWLCWTLFVLFILKYHVWRKTF